MREERGKKKGRGGRREKRNRKENTQSHLKIYSVSRNAKNTILLQIAPFGKIF